MISYIWYIKMSARFILDFENKGRMKLSFGSFVFHPDKLLHTPFIFRYKCGNVLPLQYNWKEANSWPSCGLNSPPHVIFTIICDIILNSVGDILKKSCLLRLGESELCWWHRKYAIMKLMRIWNWQHFLTTSLLNVKRRWTSM